jgi:hypothetical protein
VPEYVVVGDTAGVQFGSFQPREKMALVKLMMIDLTRHEYGGRQGPPPTTCLMASSQLSSPPLPRRTAPAFLSLGPIIAYL